MKYTVTFLINKEKDKPDGRLRCRVRWNGIISEMLVGYRVNIAGWNTDTQRCKRNSMHNDVPAQKINVDIEKMIERIDAAFADVDSLTKDQFKRRYEAIVNPDTEAECVSRLMDDFITEESVHWASGTAQRFSIVKRRVGEYAPGLKVAEMTASWLARYTAMLSRDHVNSTVNKEIKLIRWFLRWCERRGVDIAADSREYRTKLKAPQKKVIFLDWDEMMTVLNFPLSNIHDQEVRDAFMFCCFTGLRYSDAKALKRSDVSDGYISVLMQKTGEVVSIPLNKYAKSILDRYENRTDLRGKALYVCNNAEMNLTLKSVMRQCGITSEVTITTYQGNMRTDTSAPKCDVISTHSARRSFICNALMLGIPADVVMKFTGHSDYKAMKPYIDVTEKAKVDAMALFDRK